MPDTCSWQRVAPDEVRAGEGAAARGSAGAELVQHLAGGVQPPLLLAQPLQLAVTLAVQQLRLQLHRPKGCDTLSAQKSRSRLSAGLR